MNKPKDPPARSKPAKSNSLPVNAPPHMRELEIEVQKAKDILARKDRVDFLNYSAECRSKALRDWDVSRYAPLELNDKKRVSLAMIRWLFLHAISETAPVVWEELRDGPFVEYLKATKKWFAPSWDSVRAAKAADLALIALRSSLLSWAKPRGLDRTSWLLDCVLQTMHLWRVYGIQPRGQTCDRWATHQDLTIAGDNPSVFCSVNCKRFCFYLLNSFDASFLGSQPEPDLEIFPGGPRASIAKEDYLDFITMRAREHIAEDAILSIATEQDREKFITAVRKEAGARYVTQSKDLRKGKSHSSLRAALKRVVKFRVRQQTYRTIDSKSPSQDAIEREVRRLLKVLQLSARSGPRVAKKK